MTMRLFRVIVPVTDIDRAASFYSELLDQSGIRVSPGRHYFDCGGTILACYEPKADGDGANEVWRLHRNQYLYFAVPDLGALFERARSVGCQIDSSIATMPWGERLFYAQDPFGNPICFVDQTTAFTGQ